MTSQGILEAAEDVFARQGLRARMEDIAATAGVSVGTLYNYFADREQLVAGLLTYRHQQLCERLDRSVSAPDDAPFERVLHVLVRDLLEHFDAHRAFFAVLMQGEPMESVRTRSLCAIQTSLDEVVDRLDRVLARGVSSGVLSPTEAPLYAAALFGMLRATAVRTYRTQPAAGVATQSESLVRLFLDGARAPGGAPPRIEPTPKEPTP